MSERKKILWLVSWYPNKYDPFDGDFIQRHARAAALYDDIHVLFIKQSEKQQAFEETCVEGHGLTEQIIYLPRKAGLTGKIASLRRWSRTYKKEVAQIIERQRPSFIHVHVPWKVGLIAIWAKKKFGIPFFVTEHWGIYNHVVSDNIHTRSIVFRSLLKQIYSHASWFLSVSCYLAEGVKANIYSSDYSVIPNVVDTSLFCPSNQKHERFTFIHVSNMVPLKNVGSIINAFALFLKKTNSGAQLILVGQPNDEYISIAQELGLYNRSVFFRGEVAYSAVAEEMRQAHVFVLNSDMENSPCVIGEALCSGLPVIATKVGGVPELINRKSGILVPPRNDIELAEALITIYQNYTSVEGDVIAKTAKEKFSIQTIGELFHRSYGNN